MALKFRCPQCNELFSAQEDMAGAQITCPMCFAQFELPRDEPAKGSRQSKRTKTRSKSAEQQPDAIRETASLSPLEPSAASLGVPVAVSFRRRHEEDRHEMDMTPMVDVTFLLLIFFMVTAAFGLQKSYDIPAPDDSRPSTESVTLEELENDPRYVIVRVDEYDTFHVSAAAWDAEREAPSKPDLLARLREARTSASPMATHLLVMASEAATNGQVITALDAGTALGMEDVKLMTLPSEDAS